MGNESKLDPHAPRSAPDDLVIGGVQVCKKGELLTNEEFRQRCDEACDKAIAAAKERLGLP